MNQIIFESDRQFVLFDHFSSHDQLLFRSNMAKGYPHNIDVIFFSTKYIQVNTQLKGISIKRIENTEMVNYASVNEYLSYPTNNLFQITTLDGERYYIAASFFRVFENQLGFYETSLGVLEYKGRDHEIAASL